MIRWQDLSPTQQTVLERIRRGENWFGVSNRPRYKGRGSQKGRPSIRSVKRLHRLGLIEGTHWQPRLTEQGRQLLEKKT